MLKKNRKYYLRGGLTKNDMKKMHCYMLDIIENIGIEVNHNGILGLVKDIDGVLVKGNIVKFRSELVEKAILDMHYPEYAVKAEYLINGGAYELNILDLDKNEIRPSLTSDLVDMVKLADSYGLYGSSPVRPTDIKSTELQEITMFKICWENSENISNSIFSANEISTIRAAEYIYEMSEITGKTFSLLIWIKSPFKIDFKELDIIYKFLNKNVQLCVATMPIAGVTAPIYFPGAYVQSMAEVFAGLTLLNLIYSGKNKPLCLAIDTIRAYAFDFKYGSFVYGSPEDIIGTLYQTQLNKNYGIPVVAKSLLTSSKNIDLQLGVDIMAHTLTAAFAGARIFTGAGLLAIDEIYSAEKLVVDYEVVQYVKKVVDGFGFSEKSLALNLIKEIGIGGEFISHDSTLKEYKGEFWQSDIFEHIMLNKWIQLGNPKLRNKLREIAKNKIKKHNYKLPENISRELNLIYKKALKEFGN